MRCLSKIQCLFLIALCPLPAAAVGWQVDHGNSKLAFVVTWDGALLEGIYRRFDAKIIFDVNDPAKSAFDVTVNVASVTTKSADVDDGMGGADWFDYKRHPLSRFTTSAIRSLGEHRYEAEGTLSVKGISKTIKLPFTWTETASRAHMQGEATVKRAAFNIGAGEWATDPTIGYDVKVVVDLQLDVLGDSSGPRSVLRAEVGSANEQHQGGAAQLDDGQGARNIVP